MNDLIDAIAESIEAEVDGATQWVIERKDPMWRNPKKGKVLNIFHGGDRAGTPRWNGGTIDIIEVVVEYAEPAPENMKLDHDEEGEYNANAEALKLREWALAHEAGFPAAGTHRMDWLRTDYTPNVRRELFTRYCRVTFECEVVRSYA